jgi:hypothetical protein
MQQRLAFVRGFGIGTLCVWKCISAKAGKGLLGEHGHGKNKLVNGIFPCLASVWLLK